MTIKTYEIGTDGKMVLIDTPVNHRKNNLPIGTVLHWGGNMAWVDQDYVIVSVEPAKVDSVYGTIYRCVSMLDYSRHNTDGHSVKDSQNKTWHGQHFFLTEKVLNPEEVAGLVEKAHIKELAQKENMERQAVNKENAKTRILKENPSLEPVKSGSYPSAKLAAKNIRIELKKAFPGVKFSVRSEMFSGGDSVDIGWTDGPTEQEVKKISNKYEGGSFDGMTDSYTYETNIYRNAWTETFGDAKYVHENRHLSQEFMDHKAKELGYPNAVYNPNTGDYSGVDMQTSEYIRREIRQQAA